MSMIIAKQTGAKTSEDIDLTRGPFPKTIVGVGTIGAAETIAVNIVDEDGDDLPMYDTSDAAVTVDDSSEPLIITYPVVLQFVKGVTTAACGVQLIEQSV